MPGEIRLEEKYERNGWPSLPRPDLKPPKGWGLSLVTAVDKIHHHQLSPDGNRIAFIWERNDLSDVYILSMDGQWPRRLSTQRAPIATWADEVPQWSPDGQWLAFCMDDHVHVIPSGGGVSKKISDFTFCAFAPRWMPDSQGLIISVERNRETQLLLTDRNASWPRPLVTGPGDAWDAQPSPDGHRVVFVRQPHDDLNCLEVRVVELESGQIRPLISTPRQKDWWPRWSPDGKQIAFLSQRSGFNEVWLIRPDGDGYHQLTHLGRDVEDLAWSPDGKQIACTVNHGGIFELALVDVEGEAVLYLCSDSGCYARPNWSPGGDFITVEYETPNQPPDLFRVSVPGGSRSQLTFSMPLALAEAGLVMPEQTSYRSYDGLEIPALLYRPHKSNGAAIVLPHGGPAAQAIFEWDIMMQYLVAKGYSCLEPNYRGSTGFGVEFEQANYDDWGVGDTQDCLYAARFLRNLEHVSPDRMGILGPSYGGYMVACCLARDPLFLFACGVSKYGDANPVTSWAQCNRDLRLYTEMFIGDPARNLQVYLDGSPIYQVENIRKPVLILHGLLDDIVPPQAAEEWVEALRRSDKTFEYKTYADEPHGFLKRPTQLDASERIERFLDWYLLPRRLEETS